VENSVRKEWHVAAAVCREIIYPAKRADRIQWLGQTTPTRLPENLSNDEDFGKEIQEQKATDTAE
jgi:hypothetical protein